MQLFISDERSIHNITTTIQDPRIIHQCHTVLRMKTGDQFFLQPLSFPPDKGDRAVTRYTITISEITKKQIVGHISHIDTPSCPPCQGRWPGRSEGFSQLLTICIALPNRIDKAELIVQKLAEIGISQIIFFVSQRSIIRELKEKTLQRLHSIALEATEQSFGRSLPKISYRPSLDKLLSQISQEPNTHILLDHNGESREKTKSSIHIYKSEPKENKHSIYAYIGPEGGCTDNEKQKILQLPNSPNNQIATSLTLGPTNLRMETAAIITARLLQNS